MKLLLISDQEEPYLWDYYQPGRLAGYDMILSAGDLKPSYLRFLVTMANRPLLYVHGNHDVCYATDVPEGCDCVDGTLTVCRACGSLPSAAAFSTTGNRTSIRSGRWNAGSGRPAVR